MSSLAPEIPAGAADTAPSGAFQINHRSELCGLRTQESKPGLSGKTVSLSTSSWTETQTLKSGSLGFVSL